MKIWMALAFIKDARTNLSKHRVSGETSRWYEAGVEQLDHAISALAILDSNGGMDKVLIAAKAVVVHSQLGTLRGGPLALVACGDLAAAIEDMGLEFDTEEATDD